MSGCKKPKTQCLLISDLLSPTRAKKFNTKEIEKHKYFNIKL